MEYYLKSSIVYTYMYCSFHPVSQNEIYCIVVGLRMDGHTCVISLFMDATEEYSSCLAAASAVLLTAHTMSQPIAALCTRSAGTSMGHSVTQRNLECLCTTL